jgi:hypothetical protein
MNRNEGARRPPRDGQTARSGTVARQLRGAGDERCHDVTAISVQVVAGPVVARRGSGVGMAGGDGGRTPPGSARPGRRSPRSGRTSPRSTTYEPPWRRPVRAPACPAPIAPCDRDGPRRVAESGWRTMRTVAAASLASSNRGGTTVTTVVLAMAGPPRDRGDSISPLPLAHRTPASLRTWASPTPAALRRIARSRMVVPRNKTYPVDL